jgi:hypothetical protein
VCSWDDGYKIFPGICLKASKYQNYYENISKTKKTGGTELNLMPLGKILNFACLNICFACLVF